MLKVLIVAELPRQSRTMQGKPPEYTPSQLERLKSKKGQTSGTGSTENEETSIIIHPEYKIEQPRTAESTPHRVSIFATH